MAGGGQENTESLTDATVYEVLLCSDRRTVSLSFGVFGTDHHRIATGMSVFASIWIVGQLLWYALLTRL